MKNIAVLLVLLGVLASCSHGVKEAENTDTTTLNTESSETNLETNNEVDMSGTVTVDFNHFLAGKTLTFDIEMIKIEEGEVVASGSKVEVHYKGTLEDGTQFDSSYDRGELLPFTAGQGQMISGFDKAVMGMKVGDKKTITLPPEEAYGAYDETAKQVIPKENFKEFVKAGYKLEVGEVLPTQMGALKIIAVDEE